MRSALFGAGALGGLALLHLYNNMNRDSQRMIESTAIKVAIISAAAYTGGLAGGYAGGLAGGGILGGLAGAAVGAGVGAIIGGTGFHYLGVGTYNEGYDAGGIAGGLAGLRAGTFAKSAGRNPSMLEVDSGTGTGSSTSGGGFGNGVGPIAEKFFEYFVRFVTMPVAPINMLISPIWNAPAQAPNSMGP